MVNCKFCGTSLEYLPFRCKYCGGDFCKEHRLPEKHNCSFERKNDISSVKPIKATVIKINEENEQEKEFYTKDKIYSSSYDTKDNVSPWEANIIRPRLTSIKLKATYLIMILQLVGLILSKIKIIEPHFYLSAAQILNWYFHTIFTPMINPSDFFSFIFNLLVIYFIGRLIEGKFGPKLLLQIYILSAIISAGAILLIQLFLSFIPFFGTNILYFGYTTTSGAIMGLICFITLMLPNIEINAFIFLIPVRIKPKYFLWLAIGIYLFFGLIDLLYFFSNPLFPGFISEFGNVFGVLGGLIMINKFRFSNSFPNRSNIF